MIYQKHGRGLDYIYRIKVSGKVCAEFIGYVIFYCTLYKPNEHLKLEAFWFHHLFWKLYIRTRNKSIIKFLKREKPIAIIKKWRKDIRLWETKMWYGWKYELFGHKPKYCLIRK